MNIEIGTHIKIKGIPETNPNHEGRVTEVTDNGVYISNMNMPFMGTYSRHFVNKEDIK